MSQGDAQNGWCVGVLLAFFEGYPQKTDPFGGWVKGTPNRNQPFWGSPNAKTGPFQFWWFLTSPRDVQKGQIGNPTRGARWLWPMVSGCSDFEQFEPGQIKDKGQSQPSWFW